MAQTLLYLFLFMLPQNVYMQPRGDASSLTVLHVPTSWKKIFSYNNYYRYPVTRNIQWSTGLKTPTSEKILKATQALAQEIHPGQRIQMYNLEFSYMDDSDYDPSLGYKRKQVRESIKQDEIYQQARHNSTVRIPARTLLTKWQLVANVAGHEVGYNHTMDTYGNTMPHIHIQYGDTLSRPTNEEEYDYDNEYNMDHDQNHEDDSDFSHNYNHNHRNHNLSRPVQRQQFHGHHHNDISRAEIGLHSYPTMYYEKTRIRIRHKDTGQYLAVTRTRSRMSSATVSSSTDFEFILYNSSSGIRVRTLNPGYRGYEWLTSDARGRIHFTRSSRSLTQYWDLNTASHLFDGMFVTFRNNGNGREFLRYSRGQLKTHIARGTGDEWILEEAYHMMDRDSE